MLDFLPCRCRVVSGLNIAPLPHGQAGAMISEMAPVHFRYLDEERAVLAAAINFGLISIQDHVPRHLPALRLALGRGTK